MTGIVVKNTGSWQTVKTDTGTIVNCKIKGNFRLKGFRCTNPVAVGDEVEILVNPDGSAFITTIKPRKNYVIRRASNLSKEFQIIASNLDQSVLVISLKNPLTNTTFIDRFLATSEAYNIPAIIVLNKVDLLQSEEDVEYLEAIEYLYKSIGYQFLRTSTKTGEGIDELRKIVEGRKTLLSGNSGVGKSSIINALIPDASLRVGEVSQVHHTGMHTTTFSEMLDLPGGGSLIDTPGVKGFGTIDFDRNEVAHYFPEIFAASKDCRFNNCTHTHEPGCAVRRALDEHLISLSRYTSYMSIIEDNSDDKYRKPYDE